MIPSDNPAPLVAHLRKIHRSAGIVVFPLVFILGVTGFYLNHAKFFGRILTAPTVFVPAPAAAWSIEEANVFAEKILGGPVTEAAKRRKKGRLFFRLSQENEKKGRAVLETATRTYWLVTRYGESRYTETGDFIERRWFWKRLVEDLHNGRIGGWVGRSLADLVSLCLVIFAVTGSLILVLPRLGRSK